MIDSHCHLDFENFDGEREALVAGAREAGVHTIINIGTSVESSDYSIKLAERFDSIYATVGIHPSDSNSFDGNSINELRKMSSHPRVVGIGEIGLDYYRDRAPRSHQRKVFEAQLELACEVDLPIVIHTREAFRDTIEITKQYADRLPGGTFHCFPGTVEEAYEVFDIGFVISVGGVITYKKSGMADMVVEVPLDKVLLETDAPFLTPVPFRGKRNCPAYIPHVCKRLAELQQVSVAEVEKITDRTCQKLFRLVESFGV